MTKLVIFDLDGTLLDTVEDLGNATNYALRMCGFPERPLKDYYQLVGRGIYNLFRSAMPAPEVEKAPVPDVAGAPASNVSKAPVPDEAGAPASNVSKAPVPDEAMVQKMASYFLPYYGEHMCDFTKPYPGIPEMLASLVAAGIQVALASNKYQEGAEKLIRRFFPDIPFLRVLGQREGQPIKPDPQVVFQIMATEPEVGPHSQPTDKQPFAPVDEPQSQPTDRQPFAPVDEPQSQPTDRQPFAPVDEPQSQPTDKQPFDPVDEPQSQPTDKQPFAPVDEPQFQPTDKQPFAPVDEPQFQPTDKQPFAPEEVAYVGDSNVDMQTGLNAGVHTIGVTWGFRDRAELEAFHPFAVVDTIQELQELLMG